MYILINCNYCFYGKRTLLLLHTNSLRNWCNYKICHWFRPLFYCIWDIFVVVWAWTTNPLIHIMCNVSCRKNEKPGKSAMGKLNHMIHINKLSVILKWFMWILTVLWLDTIVLAISNTTISNGRYEVVTFYNKKKVNIFKLYVIKWQRDALCCHLITEDLLSKLRWIIYSNLIYETTIDNSVGHKLAVSKFVCLIIAINFQVRVDPTN